VHLAPVDLLVLYTDGLVERRGDTIEAGIDRLLEGAARHRHEPVATIADRLLEVLDGPPSDDVALVVKRMPEPDLGTGS
jgi:serine phosphatase RsbU (regulator of sigma subunit)